MPVAVSSASDFFSRLGLHPGRGWLVSRGMKTSVELFRIPANTTRSLNRKTLNIRKTFPEKIGKKIPGFLSPVKKTLHFDDMSMALPTSKHWHDQMKLPGEVSVDLHCQGNDRRRDLLFCLCWFCKSALGLVFPDSPTVASLRGLEVFRGAPLGDQPLKPKGGSFGPTKMWLSLNPIIPSKGSKVWDIFHISHIYFWGASIWIMSNQYLSDHEWNSFWPKPTWRKLLYECRNSDVNFHSETFASILFLPSIHWRFSATPNHKLVWKSCNTPV